MLPSRPVAIGPVCAENNPDLWFDVGAKQQAIDLCKGCPLRAECLVQALRTDRPEDAWAVWGGMVPHKRKRFKARYGIVTVSHARELLDAIA